MDDAQTSCCKQNMTSRRAQLLLTILLGATNSFASQDYPATEPGAEHSEAVNSARNGDYTHALSILERLRAQDPKNIELLHDETLILAWAGEDERVIGNSAFIDRTSASDYVIAAIAKSFRNEGSYIDAERWYAALLERDPENIDARAGLAMTLADQDRIEEALATTAYAVSHPIQRARLYVIDAYIDERQHRYLDALANYQRALALDPGNPAALRGQALILRALLLPAQALEVENQYPGTLTREEVLQLQVDLAAIRVRYGRQSAYPPEKRYEGVDRAITEMDTLLARDNLTDQARIRVRRDRIVALCDRLRMHDAIDEFEAMEMPPDEAPPYVLAAISSAYLFVKQPELARHYLEIATAKDPDNIDFQFRLFFVYSDLQEYDLAVELAESLASKLPIVNRAPGSPIAKPSEEHLRAVILVGLARAYSDQLEDSQIYFEALLSSLPHNTDIRQELANVYRWRGWTERSLFELQQVLTVEPDNIYAKVGRAHSHLDQQLFEIAEQEIIDLNEGFATEPPVANLNKRWANHNRQQLDVEAQFGESSGSTFGEDQYEIVARWNSHPINYNYRLTVDTHDSFAEFPEGSVTRKRIGAGVEYRHHKWFAAAGLAADRSGDNVGGIARLQYRFDDHLRLAAGIEIQSTATPLRGYRIGIASNVAEVQAQFALHESTSMRASIRYQNLTDGNHVRSALVGVQHRLYNGPFYKLLGIAEAYADRRGTDDAPYFSPLSSSTIETGIINQWLMYRRYDFAIQHEISTRIGRYHQYGYGTETTWSASYALRLDISPRWHVHAGTSRRSNVYDGNRESATFFNAGFTGLF